MQTQNSVEMTNDQSEIELKPNETSVSSEDKDAELERLRIALKKANSESANHRHKAKELDELKAKLEQEKLSETEKLQAQLAEKEQTILKHQERVVRAEVKTVAATLGFINPATAARLIDWADIEYDEHGDPTNIDELMKKLVKDEPYLVGKPQPSTTRVSATNPSRSTGSNDIEDLLLRLQRGELKDKEYAALPSYVKQRLNQRLASKSY